MRKIIILLLSLAMLISLSSCINTSKPTFIVNRSYLTDDMDLTFTIDEETLDEIRDSFYSYSGEELVYFTDLKDKVPKLHCYPLTVSEQTERDYCYCVLNLKDTYAAFIFEVKDGNPDWCLGYVLIKQKIISSNLKNCRTLDDFYQCTDLKAKEVQINSISVMLLDYFVPSFSIIDYDNFQYCPLLLTEDGFYVAKIPSKAIVYHFADHYCDTEYYTEDFDAEIASIEKIQNPIFDSLAKELSTIIV